MAVGSDSPKFVGVSCVNIVVAANAGGAFSPFGDITTLMVWQRGIIDFQTFFVLFVPSVVAYVIPAAIMHFAIPQVSPPTSDEKVEMLRGAVVIMCLFLATIITAVSYHNIFHLPPVVGMMTGLAYLQLFAYYLKKPTRLATRVMAIPRTTPRTWMRRLGSMSSRRWAAPNGIRCCSSMGSFFVWARLG